LIAMVPPATGRIVALISPRTARLRRNLGTPLWHCLADE
jgi:hypothetical protein